MSDTKQHLLKIKGILLSNYTVLHCYRKYTKAQQGLINSLLAQILSMHHILFGTCLKSVNSICRGKCSYVHILHSQLELQRSGEHLYETAICTVKESHATNYLPDGLNVNQNINDFCTSACGIKFATLPSYCRKFPIQN